MMLSFYVVMDDQIFDLIHSTQYCVCLTSLIVVSHCVSLLLVSCLVFLSVLPALVWCITISDHHLLLARFDYTRADYFSIIIVTMMDE